MLTRTRRYDLAYGPFFDANNAIATVLEDQNNQRLRKVYLLLSLLNEEEFSDADLDALVINEGIVRSDGSQATVAETLFRYSPIGVGEVVAMPRGFPIATSADETTGRAVTFVTTEARDENDIIFNSTTNRYEATVPMVALIKGVEGKVGPNRVTRPLRPLIGFDGVTNADGADEGRSRLTNDELIELYKLAVNSRQLSVPTGIEFYERDTFPSVEDVHIVFGTNPLLTRAGDDAGAVDAYVIGETLTTVTDTIIFYGTGQTLAVSTPPLVTVTSVVRASDNTTYEEDVDYEVVYDDSGIGGSTRAVDGIAFLASASSTPSVGDILTVTYTANQLIRDLQSDAAEEDTEVLGRDLLFRLGTRIDIVLTAQLKVRTRFSPTAVKTLVVQSIIDFINSLGLGDAVEGSDIQKEVRKTSGVDNFIITRLTISTVPTGTSDVSTADNEYPRVEPSSINITLTS